MSYTNSLTPKNLHHSIMPCPLYILHQLNPCFDCLYLLIRIKTHTFQWFKSCKSDRSGQTATSLFKRYYSFIGNNISCTVKAVKPVLCPSPKRLSFPKEILYNIWLQCIIRPCSVNTIGIGEHCTLNCRSNWEQTTVQERYRYLKDSIISCE